MANKTRNWIKSKIYNHLIISKRGLYSKVIVVHYNAIKGVI